MKKIISVIILACMMLVAYTQTNMSVSNPEAETIIFGNYDPAQYEPSQIINHPDTILNRLVNEVSKDTLIAWLAKIDSYYNRNTGSDTVSDTHGIGAVRRWIHSKFVEISEANENRLIVSYMNFDKTICGAPFHRNVFGILPGMDTTNKEIVFIEGHFDTRCEGACDTSCYSPGMDDNGSGTVLVMELARIMSKYAFDHTVIFALPTGEDQGLYGAKAFATYFKNNDILIRACLNNDVVGGIACGMTSSPPSCPYFNHIDSRNVIAFKYRVKCVFFNIDCSVVSIALRFYQALPATFFTDEKFDFFIAITQCNLKYFYIFVTVQLDTFIDPAAVIWFRFKSEYSTVITCNFSG